MRNIELYQALRARMTALAVGADGSAAVPACPDWTMRDLLAHVTGAADDLAEGRLDGVGTDAWTELQVQARTGQSLAEVLEEWAEAGPRMEEAVRLVFGDAPAQLIFDTVTHEHDLRQAVGATGERDADSIEVALGWVAGAWEQSAPRGPGTLRLAAGKRTIDLGDGDPDVVVTLSPFEALRALSGRRSTDQLRGYASTGPVDPWLPSFTWGPFVPRADPLDER